jgi:hypothetical protein
MGEKEQRIGVCPGVRIIEEREKGGETDRERISVLKGSAGA